jgi:hypothetical protein
MNQVWGGVKIVVSFLEPHKWVNFLVREPMPAPIIPVQRSAKPVFGSTIGQNELQGNV